MEYIWNITGKCNYSCNYCWDKYKNIKEASLASIYAFIDNSIDKNDKIILTGGEPFVYSSIFKLINKLKEKNIANITICTNGSLLDKYQNEIIDSGINEIQISYDKFNDKIFNSIKKINKSIKVVLVFLINKNTFEDIFDAVEITKSNNLFFAFQFETSNTEWQKNMKKSELLCLYDKLELLYRNNKDIIDVYNYNYIKICKNFYIKGIKPDKCYCGISSKVITPNLKIENCYWSKKNDLPNCFNEKCLVWFRYDNRLRKVYKLFSDD